MAGPISRAFVDIVARFRVEQGGDLEKALKGQIRDLESELGRLEGAAGNAGRAIAKQLGQQRINLGVRDAIVDLQRVENAADGTVNSLRGLQELPTPKFKTDKITRDINRIEEQMRELGRSLQRVDGEEVDLNVTDATRQLKNLERAATRLETELGNISDIRFNTQVEGAIGDLERLKATIDTSLTNLERIDKTRVRVRVDDIELTQIASEVERLTRGTDVIKLKVEESGLNRVKQGVDRLHISVNDLGDQFRNIAFRAASFLAVGQAFSAFQRIISFGIEAAGRIQTVTVSLNRLFADMTQLGSTASEFIGELRDVAIKTPFEFIDLADTSRRLVQLGGDADTTIERMKSLADAGAAVGATSDDINGVVRALSQLKAKGRINLQDLNQVAERLPNFQRTMQLQGVIDELEAIGSPLAGTITSFDDLREAGVGIDTVINGIFRGLENIPGAAGAAAAQARTLEGALSNLRDFAQIEFSDAFRNAGATLADELNSAFSEIGNTAADTTDTMADGFREVISAFGTGLDDALPEVIDFAANVSDEFAGMADAIGNLVESLASGFSGDVFQGLLTGLTGVINLATAANEILTTLIPPSLAGGIGQVAAQIIALTRIGIPAFAPFQKVINDVILSFNLAEGSAQRLRTTFSLMNTSLLAGAGAAALALAALTVVTNKMADASRRAREFDQSINTATRSLEEFNDLGSAVLDFLENFENRGEGINLGPLEDQFDGLTVNELASSLNASRDELATLVIELAKLKKLEDTDTNILRVGGGEVDALKTAGISADDLGIGAENAAVNVEALVTQLSEAAEVTVRTAATTKRFGFVSENTTKRIAEAAEATEGWVAAEEELNKLNIAGAKSTFFDLADDLNVTASEQRQIIANNTDLITGTEDWVAITGELQLRMQNVNLALLDLKDRAPELLRLADVFDKAATKGNALKSATGDFSGQGGFRTALVDFAVLAADAELSAADLDAIVQELGSSLTGEELGEKFTEISTAVDEMTTALEGVLPGIGNLQFEADSFSLSAFIKELERVSEARGKLTENIGLILDKFGTLGADAISALTASGLNPDQMAIAVSDLLSADAPELQHIVDLFGTLGEESSRKLAERLIAFGITEEEAKAIAGVDKFIGTGTAAAAGFNTGFNEELLKGIVQPGTADAFVGAVESALARGAEGGSGVGKTPEVPEIDTTKAVKTAEDAGKEVSEAFSEEFNAGIADINSDLEDALTDLLKSLQDFGRAGADILSSTGNQMSQNFATGISRMDTAMFIEIGQVIRATSSLSNILKIQGLFAGLSMTNSFSNGLRLSEVLQVELATVVGRLNSTALNNSAFRSGFDIGFQFGRGMAAGIRTSIAFSIEAAIQLVQESFRAAQKYAGIASPSKLFAELGHNISLGVSAGILQGLPGVQSAMVKVAGAATQSLVGGPTLSSTLASGNRSALALRRTSLDASSLGRPMQTATAATPAGATHSHLWNINAPTDDPETLARRVAVRLERMVE